MQELIKKANWIFTFALTPYTILDMT